MATKQATFLVLGATGGTGKHFVSQALADGHRVRVLVRNPEKLTVKDDKLEVVQGSITDYPDTDSLVMDVNYVVAMLGDRASQQSAKICEPFIKRLVPSMREHGVKNLLYQAGGLSRPYQGSLSPILWVLRYTLARGYNGQHEDNEAVHKYLVTEASDINWIVHRAGIGGDGPSKGTLVRSATNFSVATHRDCADYSYRTITDPAAKHTCDFSHYARE